MDKNLNRKDVLKQFIKTDRFHHRLLDKNVSKVGLHRCQHGVLLHLLHAKEAPTQKELAMALDISSAAMTKVLKRLEEDGYILRVAQENDLRCLRITLTEKGKSILEQSRALVEEVDKNMFNGFSEDELASFYECLNKIYLNLTIFEESEK